MIALFVALFCVQWILFLQEMLRFSDDNQESEVQLREALDCMLEVVRFVNDSMHQVSIVGFPVSFILLIVKYSCKCG